MKTTKNITTKQTMTKVANSIEKSINEAISIFSANELEVNRDNNEDWVTIEIGSSNPFGFLTGPEVETIQKVVKAYTEKYITCVFYGFGTKPLYVLEHHSFMYQPTLVVTIRMREAA